MSERETIAVWWNGPVRDFSCCGQQWPPTTASVDDAPYWPIWQCGNCGNRYGGARDYEMEEAFANACDAP